MTRPRLAAVAASAVSALILLSGAAQDAKPVKGAVRIDGSSTVYPIAEAIAEEFSEAAPGVNVTVGMSGTGGGFKRFGAGETDASNASRPIKPAEADACKAKGIEFVELPIAYDGLTIVVHKDNTWAKQITIEQIKKAFGADGSAKTWKDLDPSWPDEPLKGEGRKVYLEGMYLMGVAYYQSGQYATAFPVLRKTWVGCRKTVVRSIWSM